MHQTEGLGHIVAEKVDGSRKLFEGYLGVHARRVLQILAGSGEHCRDLPLPGDHRAQTLVRGRVVTFHDHENAIRLAAGVKIGILLPHPYGFQLKQTRADLALDETEIVSGKPRGAVLDGLLKTRKNAPQFLRFAVEVWARKIL